MDDGIRPCAEKVRRRPQSRSSRGFYLLKRIRRFKLPTDILVALVIATMAVFQAIIDTLLERRVPYVSAHGLEAEEVVGRRRPVGREARAVRAVGDAELGQVVERMLRCSGYCWRWEWGIADDPDNL